MKSTLLLIIVLWFFADISYGFELRVEQKQSEQVVDLNGPLSLGMDADPTQPSLRQFSLLEKNKTIRLRLDSLGGDVLAAIRINEALNSTCPNDRGCQIIAEVHNSCVSACGLIFFNADQRFLGRKSKLGIHAATMVSKNPYTGEVVDTRIANPVSTFAMYVQWGFPPDLLRAVGIGAFSSLGVTYLNSNELLKSGLISGIL